MVPTNQQFDGHPVMPYDNAATIHNMHSGTNTVMQQHMCCTPQNPGAAMPTLAK